MKSFIVNIGDEVIKGVVLNTHIQFLSLFAESLGIDMKGFLGVLDRKDDIKNALDYASSQSDIIFLTGGLGPTQDDMTKEALCEYLNEDLIFDSKDNQRMKGMFKERNLEYTKNNEKQAYYFKESLFLENPFGIVRGHYVKRKQGIFILLPGPPIELEPMVNISLKPLIEKEIVKDSYLFVKEYSFVGVRESVLEELIHDLIVEYENDIHIGTYAFIGYIAVRVICYQKDLEPRAVEFCNKIITILKPYLVSSRGEKFEQVLLSLLEEQNTKLILAESCTGGYVASRLVSVKGASRGFESSLVTYSNTAKNLLLDVSSQTLNENGAVSEKAAQEMILGLKKIYNGKLKETPYFIAITGNLATLDDNQENQGKVFIAQSYGQEAPITVQEYDVSFYKDRDMARYVISQRALETVWKDLKAKKND